MCHLAAHGPEGRQLGPMLNASAARYTYHDDFGNSWTWDKNAGGACMTPGTRVCDDILKWEEQVRFPDYREWDLAENSFAAGTAQARVQALWRSAGSVTDAAGFNTLDGCYLIACTSAFGDVGDRITFYFDDGTAIECVKVDAKAESVAAHDGHPATRWGHAHDANVLEFCGTDAIGDDPYLALGLDGRRVVSATNHGSIL